MTQKVYDALRKALVEGVYGSGFHLREVVIAKQFGVSRTPVREAVRKLAAEGWLEIKQNQGAFVRAWSREDIEEVLSLRAMLESHAAWHAALNASGTQIEELRAICKRSLDLMPRVDSEVRDEVAVLNGQFHRAVIEASGQIRTAEILAALIELPITTRYFQRLDPEHVRRGVMEHQALLEAIMARDPHWAGALMKAHIHAGKSFFIRRESAGSTPSAEPYAIK